MAFAHDAQVIPDTENSVRTSAERGPVFEMVCGVFSVNADFPDLTDLEKEVLGIKERFSFFALSSAWQDLQTSRCRRFRFLPARGFGIQDTPWDCS
jgi:hypothetical protein